ncbi:cobalamin-dependent protein [Methylobacterium sp. AMS5]|uniref:cobalamin B12-binding domain-containing protein n=1 Tax=Methylobacterium sp. AMS5 TaxID=925818 RepID=UPI00074F96D4|nr:cobalamin-dependent protein [Methylobacterium sp. AMS5]AMB48155.1 cobalamin-binding protein [Methylobacterium sp. AMS5]
MGDWRHFGERLEFPAVAPECGVVAEPLVPSAFEQQPDGLGMRRQLASVVEAEILPRLMLAHRERATPRPAVVGHRPTPDEVQRLSDLLLARTDTDLAPHLLRILDEGLTLEGMLVDLLAPVARHLGWLWEEDTCDFVDVTVALGRLQAATRELCARLENDAVDPAGRSILLLPGPGETHVFCLSLVATIFRESGWDVTTTGAHSSLDAADLVRMEWFDILGLTLSCDVFLPALTDRIRALRAASCNTRIKVLVGGPYFVRNPDHVRLVGADGTAEDGRLAPLIAESLLEMRTRAC